MPLTVLLQFEIPIKLVPGDNEHKHWRTRATRVGKAREATSYCWRNAKVSQQPVFPPSGIVVTITRVAPNALDAGDNLNSSAKAVRDQIASELGLPNDRDPRVTWTYDQVYGAKYAARVRVATGARASWEARGTALADACKSVIADLDSAVFLTPSGRLEIIAKINDALNRWEHE